MKKNVLSINNWTGKREVNNITNKSQIYTSIDSQMALRWMIRNDLIVVKNRQNIDKTGRQTMMFRINLIK